MDKEKEVQIKTQIAPADLDRKINQVLGFVDKDIKVKVSIISFGRMATHPERQVEVLGIVKARLVGKAKLVGTPSVSVQRISFYLIKE